MNKFSIIALGIAAAFGLSACQPPSSGDAQPTPPAASGESPAASGASAGAGGSVNIGVNDHACEPMELTVPSGQVVFNIKNNSGRT